jgi:hypothetical protein
MKRLVFLLFCSVSVYSYGQKVRQYKIWNEVHFEAGVNQIREENIHGKRHAGPLLGFNYSYGNIKKNICSIEAGLGISGLKTSDENRLSSANVRLHANCYYLFPAAWDNKISYFPGPEISLDYSASFYPNWDESRMYWADYMGAGIRNKFVFAVIPRNQFILDVSIPVIFLLSRPNPDRKYKADDFSFSGIMKNLYRNPEVLSLKKSVVVKTTLEHQMKTAKSNIPAFYYSFCYYKLRTGNRPPFRNIVHQFGVKFYL